MFSIVRSAILLLVFSLPAGLYAADALPPQSSTESGVTIKVTPQNLQGAIWEFTVVLDTHSQELNDDLVTNVVLVKPDGTKLAPVAWQGDPPSGHHRKGVLRFDAITPPPATLEMRIARPGEQKARTLRWTLN